MQELKALLLWSLQWKQQRANNKVTKHNKLIKVFWQPPGFPAKALHVCKVVCHVVIIKDVLSYVCLYYCYYYYQDINLIFKNQTKLRVTPRSDCSFKHTILSNLNIFQTIAWHKEKIAVINVAIEKGRNFVFLFPRTMMNAKPQNTTSY